MKFVDEAIIRVQAGKGGDGCLSFRRERYIPLGGPNGADGGDGGNIYLVAEHNINTLVDFRYKRSFKAVNGQHGMGSNCTGKCGEDLVIPVPVGTEVWDHDTEEKIGDLTKASQKLLVAEGGKHGLGNLRFKTSTNRAPRKTTKGKPGETRNLHLELKVLADVGLLGLPNAGKSTLISSISAAKPKVADYPFTTLHPNLGVVKVADSRSFVMADIPGIIEGAAEGAGLGLRFLKHLARTKLLLHVLDISESMADIDQCVANAKSILNELKKYNAELYNRPRWLVLNKVDLLALQESELQDIKKQIIEKLEWQGPVFIISGVTGFGTKELIYSIMEYVEENF